MKKENKELYFTPESEEVMMSLQGVIAASGLDAPDFEDGGDLFAI